MSIPCSQPSDVLLVYLFHNNSIQIGEWVTLKSIAEKLVPFLINKKAPEFVSCPWPSKNIPWALLTAVENLKKKLYVDVDHFDDRGKVVRLTPLGTFIALAHELPEGLLDS